MRHPSESLSSADDTVDLSAGDEELLTLSADEIEAAYERALHAITAAEQVMSVEKDDLPCDGTFEEQRPHSTDSTAQAVSTASRFAAEEAHADRPGAAVAAAETLIQPRQVIEAALFVGGASLTTKRLGSILGEGTSAEDVEELVASLNSQYAREYRPYEIRLGEGGYRLTLREAFEAVQDRVYGNSPKDVKLSQEAMEVLAFVAYRQPVNRDDLEETGKSNPTTLIRQLMRRQLVQLERSEADANDVTYHTTPRFLELFGLRSLKDLPLPEDFVLK